MQTASLLQDHYSRTSLIRTPKAFARWLLRALFFDPSSQQLDILGHEGDTFCVNGTHIGVLELRATK